MKKNDAGELAWELFQKTGNVTYYMPYKQHNGKQGGT